MEAVLDDNTNAGRCLVDMNLKGKSCVPLAKLLEAERKPFVIATGYEQLELAHDWVLRKPLTPEELVAALEKALRSSWAAEADAPA